MHSYSIQVGVEWAATRDDRLVGPRYGSGKHGWMLELGFGRLVFWISTL